MDGETDITKSIVVVGHVGEVVRRLLGHELEGQPIMYYSLDDEGCAEALRTAKLRVLAIRSDAKNAERALSCSKAFMCHYSQYGKTGVAAFYPNLGSSANGYGVVWTYVEGCSH